MHFVAFALLILGCANDRQAVADEPTGSVSRQPEVRLKARDSLDAAHAATRDKAHPSERDCATGRGAVWKSDFTDRLRGWGRIPFHWGAENIAFQSDDERKGLVMRVAIPEGSIDDVSMRKMGRPPGGTGFPALMLEEGKDCLYLSYAVRFAENFDFVKGGKLPGLLGGKGYGGGVIPNGRDGFSTRYMWRENGLGEVYAYLPTSVKWGTSLGRGQFRFVPGKWHRLQQQVVLNSPGEKDGVVRVWLDGEMVVEVSGLRFRDTYDLRIDGIYFTTFFGGNDPSWATPKDTYVEFAEFALSETFDR